MKRAAVVSPIRTGVGKYLGALSDLTAGKLGVVVLKALVERTGVDPQRIGGGQGIAAIFERA